MSGFKRVVNVIPLTRVALTGTQFFSYLVPLPLTDQMRPGQLVKIPFGNRHILGVTSSVEMHRLPQETRGFKTLSGLIDSTPVVTEKNLVLATALSEYYVVSPGLVLKAMLPKLVRLAKEPPVPGYEKFDPDFVLNEYQRLAVAQISNALGSRTTFLLHGVTGSGKTEVYMQVIARILESERQTIMLVPEISLSDQAIERFARRFGMARIAVWHSRLKAAEKLFMWQKIRAGEKQIIIGPRSAVFAPVRNLGLLILDEEHDSSFKQYDQKPKYHARHVAEKLSEIWRCPLILGDATPSVESFFNTTAEGGGKSLILKLPHRIKADVGLPRVSVIDMRKEIASGNTSIFSGALRLAILENLRWNKQIILFLNRRGAATFVMCRDCGHVEICPDCDVPLTYHLTNKLLLCHHCGKIYQVPHVCPVCQGSRIKYFGTGTQGVEEELKKFLQEELPKAVLPAIVRMDRDSTTKIGSGLKIYEDWKSGQIRILIGTQIVTKGWDVSGVGLVGIISADTILHLPDFRSTERTFQILTQVAGRSGRGSETGSVILQSYNPENFAIKSAKLHDYEGFFWQDIEARKKYGYPPFKRLVKITVKHQNLNKVLEEAMALYRKLLSNRSFPYEVLGPTPSFIPRLKGKYQYQILLKIAPEVTSGWFELLRDVATGVDIDVDPESLL